MKFMNDEELIQHLRNSIDLLLEIAGSQISNASETTTRFSLRLPSRIQDLVLICGKLSPVSDLLKIVIDYEVGNCNGSASLSARGLIVDNWEENPDLDLPISDVLIAQRFSSLSTKLSSLQNLISFEELQNEFQLLADGGVRLNLASTFFLEKSSLLEQFSCHQRRRLLLYVQSQKLVEAIKISTLQGFCELFAPTDDQRVVVLLGDALGLAAGDHLTICGRDQWDVSRAPCSEHQDNQKKSQFIKNVTEFRREECNWDLELAGLTPTHLQLSQVNLNQQDLVEFMRKYQDVLVMTYLCDKLRTEGQSLYCEYRGQKKVQVKLPPPTVAESSNGSLFKLYSWSYDNFSSDKLEMVRQVVALQLTDNPDSNFTTLNSKASDILEIAKSNFQLYLRRGVEQYFDKRLKVSEFLQKFSEDVGKSITDLTNELIGNLYKTLGIIAADVLAIIIRPDLLIWVVGLTALAYFVYMLVIIVSLFFSNYWRLINKAHDYSLAITQLQDVLSNQEIIKLQGDSFTRAIWYYRCSFFLVMLIYGLLAGFAWLFMSEAFRILS